MTTQETPAPCQKPPRRRTRTPHTRRAALMDAAEQLFLNKGVAATSIEDITSAAHVAKGTFYLYFESRDAMLSALQMRFIQGFCDRIQVAIDKCPAHDWNARLSSWFSCAIDELLGHLMLHDMLFHDTRPSEGRQLLSSNPVLTQLTDLLESGVQAGVWHITNPYAMAIMIFHSMHGLADEAVTQGTTDLRQPLVQLLNETFIKVITR